MPSKEWYKENDYRKVLKNYIVKKDRTSYILDKNNLPPKINLSFRKTPVYRNGEKYNQITLLYPCGVNTDGRVMYVCKCDCERYFLASDKSIMHGNAKSCGCKHQKVVSLRNGEIWGCSPKDMIGKKFGLLTVIGFLGYKQKGEKRRAFYKCLCECGRECEKDGVYLRRGDVKACGICSCYSINEKIIAEWLENKKITYKKEVNFSDLLSNNGVMLRFDFGIYKNNELVCLIEYDGEQHYISRNTGIFAGEYDKIHNRDLLKNEYCKKKNIPLYRIRYDEDTILRLEEIFNELRS